MMRTFRAFQNRNYTLFFVGQSVSQMGTWMQRTAVSWVVYSLTHSEWMLGLSVFAAQFPSFILSLWGGVVADRYDRFKLLLLTQTISLVQATVLAVLVLTGHYNVTVIFVLSGVLGIINAFDVPARQPLVNELVRDKSQLPNAIALNSAMVNFARLAGPAFAGMLLTGVGAGFCFLLNALSFIAVVGSLLLLQLPADRHMGSRSTGWGGLVEVIRYVRDRPAIGKPLLMLVLMSFFVFPFDVLLPVFAKETFHGDAATYGYIRSFIGLGAVGSTFFLASLKPGSDMQVVLWGMSIVAVAGIMLFSGATPFPLAMGFAVVAGFGVMSQSTIYITIAQMHTDAPFRGRVISLLAMALFGMMPLGSLAIGAVSKRIGAPYTLLGEGLIGAAIVAGFSPFLLGGWLRRKGGGAGMAGPEEAGGG